MHTVLPPLPTTANETVYDAAGSRLLTMTIAPEQSLFFGRWYGYATPESIQSAMCAVLAFAEQHRGPRCALSDGSEISGDWMELLPWVSYDFLPAFLATGVRAVAFLPPHDTASRMGLAAFTMAARLVFPARVFDREAEARRWLAQYQAEEE